MTILGPALAAATHLLIAAPADDGSFSVGALLLWVLGFLSLGVVSSLGIMARMRDRRAERIRDQHAIEEHRRDRRAAAERTDPGEITAT
ncbi:hypothetical protein [Nakamurella leprariae]|uniref:Uncharacterized protein n=1 Tax=Nakamurella leprariae TaxID=2803911 RepID=A0A938YJJ4_9ACTN|nr:hypothetical protein [Nakamurella leprariae]MBM9469038.1 hypothetical protein [Nakamurella leprariae]